MRDSNRHGRNNKRPTFWVPESFHPENTLPPRLLPHRQSAYYLTHCIILRLASGDRDCARLKNEYLRNIINSRQCETIIKALISSGDIRRVSGYFNGVQAYGYLPGKQYESQPLRQFKPIDPQLLGRLDKLRDHIEVEKQQYRKPIHDIWEAWQRRMRIDIRQARQTIAQLPDGSNPYDIQTLIVERIRRREHPFSVDDYGRVHNAITSLHRTLRPTLRIQRQKLTSVDIVNSQPALLALLIHRQGSHAHIRGSTDQSRQLSIYHATPFTPPEGFSEYQKLATTGRLYEHLMAKTGQSRSDVKVGLLRDVFGKRGQYPSVVEQSFRESFPGVWSFVRRFNGDDHGALLKKLQRVEPDLVIHQVGNRLAQATCGPCVSLHDSVFCRGNDLVEVTSAFARQFESTGFAMRLKVV